MGGTTQRTLAGTKNRFLHAYRKDTINGIDEGPGKEEKYLRPFEPESLAKVILGAKMDEREKEALRRLIRHTIGSNVAVADAVLDTKEYKIVF